MCGCGRGRLFLMSTPGSSWLEDGPSRPLFHHSLKRLSGVLGSSANALAEKRGAGVKVCLLWGRVFPFPCWSRSWLSLPCPLRGCRTPVLLFPGMFRDRDFWCDAFRDRDFWCDAQRRNKLSFIFPAPASPLLCDGLDVPPGLMCHRVPGVLSRD